MTLPSRPRRRRISRSLTTIAAALTALALFATACNSSTVTDTTAAPSAPAEDDAPDANSAPEPANEPDEQTTFDGDLDAPLFLSWETDAPYNLDGGATSSDEGVIITTDNPRDALRDEVVGVTGLWETDWTRSTVDTGELLAGLRGTDPRDGIRPIDEPAFENIAQASQWLGVNEPGALVRVNGEARFYPLSILTAHEIVNDRFGDVPVAITFCPLCNTAVAFDRRVDGEVLRLGVSGLLRNSDLVMWDRDTTSLWQQATGEGIVGSFAGTQLESVSSAIVSFSQFAESFPDGLSLSRELGLGRSYGRNPYEGYSSSQRPFLFDGEPDPRFPALSRVVGVRTDATDKAYPFDAVAESQVVNDTIGDQPVVVFWAPGTTDALDRGNIAESAQIGSAVAHDPTVDGDVLTFSVANPDAHDGTFVDDQTGSTWSVIGIATDGPLAGTELANVEHKNEFWFAWAAFFPEGAVWS